MKDVFLLHDNARPLSSLRRREAIAETERTVLPQYAYSPDSALFDYHLFGPALHGRHFADGNELIEVFLMSSGILQHWYTASYQR
jgi:hypothetical protein